MLLNVLSNLELARLRAAMPTRLCGSMMIDLGRDQQRGTTSTKAQRCFVCVEDPG